MTTETIVKVGDYEVSHTNGTHFVARRNGQLWRDLTGDNLVLALVSRIDQLEKAFTQPTSDMIQAGLAEVQRMLDEWYKRELSCFAEPVTAGKANVTETKAGMQNAS